VQNLLTKLIRWASVVRAGSDADQFPTQQVEYLGKVADCIMVFPYGMHANVHGDSLAVMLAMNGALDNRAAIPSSMNNRQALAGGEVMIYSPLSGSSVIFKANGDIIANAKGNITAIAGGNVSVTASGTADVTASGALSLNSSASIALTAPAIGLNGAVTVVGGLNSDSVTVSGALSQGGKNVGAAHVHSGVTTGTSNTGGVV
jgi:hypothetical protein